MERDIQPIDGVLAVYPEVREEERTKGGLILPGGRDEYIEYGEVIATGGKVNNDRALEDEIKVGHHIIFRKIAGPSLVSHERRILLIKSEHVIAIIHETPDKMVDE